MDAEALAARLREAVPETVLARNEVTVIVSPEEVGDTLRRLRVEEDLAFDFLSDLTATDWPGREPRFWVAYHMLSTRHAHRIRVKAGLAGENPHVPTVTPLFPTANWLEREVYDFFGVIFDGHPDLRRIEMPEGWVGHPLRKDHPLAGVNTQFKGAFIPPPDQRGV
jgi:NADH-quinone oxidoreductase subunit C